MKFCRSTGFRNRLRILFLVLSTVLWAGASASADVATGKAAFEAGDYGKALNAFLPDAQSGKPEAQYWMGRIYEGGFGVPEDARTAFEWFEKAGELGHADAQRIVGAFYAAGKVVGKSPSMAVKWYARAVEGGNAKAMRNLGYIYYFGEGVRRDAANLSQLSHFSGSRKVAQVHSASRAT